MATIFFSELYPHLQHADLKFTMAKFENDKIILTLLPMNKGLQDDAKHLIQPMVFKGTPQELDEVFLSEIQKPLEETVSFFSNVDSYMKQLEEAKKQSKIAEEEKNKQGKEKNERKKKYDEMMKKVQELESKEKWGEAAAALPKADQFPEQSAEIKAKHDELMKKVSERTLF